MKKNLVFTDMSANSKAGSRTGIGKVSMLFGFVVSSGIGSIRTYRKKAQGR